MSEIVVNVFFRLSANRNHCAYGFTRIVSLRGLAWSGKQVNKSDTLQMLSALKDTLLHALTPMRADTGEGSGSSYQKA